MFIPYITAIENCVRPVSNKVIIAITTLFFLLVEYQFRPIEPFVLDGFNASLFSHMLMHHGWLHLIGNMFFLWVFGNAVCAYVGNATYPSLYIFLGVLAAIAFMLIDGTPGIGASGAANGILGVYLFLFPRSQIRCMWTTRFQFGETFEIKAYWLIGIWFSRDLYGAFYSDLNIAYVSHIAGFIAGLLTAWAFHKLGWIKRGSAEPNLAQLLNKVS